MKFAKQLVALAVVGAAFSAFAESDINTAAGPSSAIAKLDFRITVPRVVFLQVGTGTLLTDVATVDLVNFTLTPTDVGSGVAEAGVSTGGVINARVLANGGGNVSFTAAGSGTGLTGAGLPVIPWSQIVPTATGGTLIHPAISGGASTLTAVAGVVNQSTVYSFNYSNTNTMQAGTYNGQVIYTATQP